MKLSPRVLRVIGVAAAIVGLTAYGTEAMTTGIAPRNWWGGAQVAYNLDGNGEFADNLQAAAQFKLQAWVPRFVPDQLQFPFLGNVARLSGQASDDERRQLLQSLLTSVEGVYFKFAPNYQWGAPDDYGVNAWVSAGWRMNAVPKENEGSRILHQGRFSIGVGASIGDLQPSEKPATISVEGLLTRFSADDFQEAFESHDGGARLVSGRAKTPSAGTLSAFERSGISRRRLRTSSVSTSSRPNTRPCSAWMRAVHDDEVNVLPVFTVLAGGARLNRSREGGGKWRPRPVRI
jgi:hypothetical protein